MADNLMLVGAYEYWPLLNLNASLNGNTLTNVHGTMFTTGAVSGEGYMVGGGDDFNATTAKLLSRADNANLRNNAGDFEYSFWWTPTGDDGFYQMLAKGDPWNTGNGLSIGRIRAASDAAGYTYAQLSFDNGNDYAIATQQGFQAGVISGSQFVDVWYEAATKTLNLQVNGLAVLSVQPTTGVTPDDDVAWPLVFGGGYGNPGPTDPGAGLVGNMGSVARFNTLRTTEQRALLFGRLPFDEWDSGEQMPISDAFGGTGILDDHLSDQGKPWVQMSGSLSLNGSGLSTDLAGVGEYYLNDPAFGVASPERIDLNLDLPTIPAPTDEAMDIWLFAFGAPLDSDFVNTLSLNLIYRSVGHWSWEADADDINNNFDFATGSLPGPPSQISINPTTGEFLIDDVVVAGPLSVMPTFGAASRMGVKMSFVTGVNVRATSIAAATPGPAVPSAPSGVAVTAGDMQALLQWTPNAGGDAVLSYNIYVALAAGGPYVLTNNVDVSRPYAVITSLGDGTTYYFKVGAVNSEGESSLSSAVSVTPSAPALLPHTGNAMRMYMYGHS